VDALLAEAEFDSVFDYVQSGVDAIEFTATGLLTHCQLRDMFISYHEILIFMPPLTIGGGGIMFSGRQRGLCDS